MSLGQAVLRRSAMAVPDPDEGTRSRPYAARRSELTDASMGSIEGPG